MAADGTTLKGVQARIKKANRIFVQLYRLWKNRNRLTMIKIRMFSSNVKLALMTGCETWKVTTHITNKFKKFVDRNLCSFMDIRWPKVIIDIRCPKVIMDLRWPKVISSAELWEATGAKPVM